MRILLVALTLVASLAAQAPAFERGDIVRVRPPATPNEGGTRVVLTVVGIPGDRLHLLNSRLYVNENLLTGFSEEFLSRVAARVKEEVVPTGHYYVMGERRVNASITEYWGLHPAARLERVQ